MDNKYIRLATQEANSNMKNSHGAVLVIGRKIVARSHNSKFPLQDNSPSTHAEESLCYLLNKLRPFRF